MRYGTSWIYSFEETIRLVSGWTRSYYINRCPARKCRTSATLLIYSIFFGWFDPTSRGEPLLYIIEYIYYTLWKKSFLVPLLPFIQYLISIFLIFRSIGGGGETSAINDKTFIDVVRYTFMILVRTKRCAWSKIRKSDLLNLSHYATAAYIAIGINIPYVQYWQTYVLDRSPFSLSLSLSRWIFRCFDSSYASSLTNLYTNTPSIWRLFSFVPGILTL